MSYKQIMIGGAVITVPDEPEPMVQNLVASVTMAQARKALVLAGFDLAKVETVLLSLPSLEQQLARIDWEFSGRVHRDNPLVAAVAKSQGWDDKTIDELFESAGAL